MTQPTANCPNCGAKITFRWSASVQTVCEYCKSILVRTDIDLKKVGQVADLPPNSSPIQMGTEGVYDGRSFVAIGRIIYEYDQGNWNEWHLMMNNGTSGWLSDAQDQYAITFAAPGRKLPKQCKIGQEYAWDKEIYTVSTITKAHYRGVDGTSGWLSDAQDQYAITFAAPGRKLPKQCKIGQEYAWDKEIYTVSTITKAHYRGVEGELPFQYWDKSNVIFVDLMSHDGRFATIDYSDDEPVIYLGEAVDFEDLKLKNLRSFEGWS